MQWQGDMFPLPHVSGQVLAGSLLGKGNDVSPYIQSGSDMEAKPHGMTTTASSSNLEYQLVIIGRSTCGRHGPAQFQVQSRSRYRQALTFTNVALNRSCTQSHHPQQWSRSRIVHAITSKSGPP